MNRVCGACLIVVLMAFPMKANAQQPSRRLGEDERRALLDVIRSAVKTQSGWTQIRAAECLIGQGHPEETLDVFRPLVETAPSQERIGVWRVLAQAEPSEEVRRNMVERIWQAFLDENGSDRVHAVEALAKLHEGISNGRRRAVEEFARRPAAEAAFARWLLAISGEVGARKALVDTLKDRDPIARLRASYSLSQLRRPADTTSTALLEAARAEAADSQALLTLIAAAAKLGEDREPFRKKLVEATRSKDPEWRRQAANFLADVGEVDDLPALTALGQDDLPAIRMTAANARLRIDARLGK